MQLLNSDLVYHVDNAAEMTNSTMMTLSTTMTARLMLTSASSTSPKKQPMTYTRVNGFGPHMDSNFRRGRLICGATYTRVYTVAVGLQLQIIML